MAEKLPEPTGALGEIRIFETHDARLAERWDDVTTELIELRVSQHEIAGELQRAG